MQHVMIDLYHVDESILADREHLLHVLRTYPAVIGMVAAGDSVLRDIKTSSTFDDGMSGFTIICTSHISLHSWPPYGMVNLDVFSCEPFTVETAVQFAQEQFGATDKDTEVHVVERATRSPREAFFAEQRFPELQSS